jgi:hypothetical protein
MAHFVVFSTAADQSAIGNADEVSAPIRVKPPIAKRLAMARTK